MVIFHSYVSLPEGKSMESLGFENYHGGFRFPKGTRLVLRPVVT
jgi:hypothetical protein